MQLSPVIGTSKQGSSSWKVLPSHPCVSLPICLPPICLPIFISINHPSTYLVTLIYLNFKTILGLKILISSVNTPQLFRSTVFFLRPELTQHLVLCNSFRIIVHRHIFCSPTGLKTKNNVHVQKCVTTTLTSTSKFSPHTLK